MITVYVLQSTSSCKIYIGQTEDPVKRLERHNSSRSKSRSYTKLNRGPWKIVYQEEYQTRAEAVSREKFLKSHRGRDWLRYKLKGP